MKKKVGILILILVILFLVVGIWYKMYQNQKSDIEESRQEEKQEIDTNMNVILSLEDTITNNSTWCGTFNLVWNDLKNDLAKQDIVFIPQLDIVRNLNKGTFNSSYLSEDSYYKKYGVASLALKQEIEDAIQKKFNETSDILNDFDWEQGDYFLYAMLKKQFEFPKEFTQLEPGNFGEKENVTYFGIDGQTDKEVREQVEVLYYESKDKFAVKLKTKTNDEVIIARGLEANTFGSSYEEIKKKKEEYKGNQNFTEEDSLKIPDMKVDLKKEIKEVEHKTFSFANGETYVIDKALQTIKFELNKKGGSIKSEAGIGVKAISLPMEEEPREFLVDDTFSLFLVEKGKDLPYFAAKISDITNVQ